MPKKLIVVKVGTNGITKNGKSLSTIDNDGTLTAQSIHLSKSPQTVKAGCATCPAWGASGTWTGGFGYTDLTWRDCPNNGVVVGVRLAAYGNRLSVEAKCSN